MVDLFLNCLVFSFDLVHESFHDRRLLAQSWDVLLLSTTLSDLFCERVWSYIRPWRVTLYPIPNRDDQQNVFINFSRPGVGLGSSPPSSSFRPPYYRDTFYSFVQVSSMLGLWLVVQEGTSITEETLTVEFFHLVSALINGFLWEFHIMDTRNPYY